MVQVDRHAGIGLGATMVHALAKNWWLLFLRGIAAIIFGVLALAWPGMTLLTLILFYGAFTLIDGVLAIIAAITGGAPTPRWWLAIVGLLGIAAGALTFMMPGLTAVVLLYFIAGWAIATGAFQIIGAIRLRKEIDNEWFLILGGIVSVPVRSCHDGRSGCGRAGASLGDRHLCGVHGRNVRRAVVPLEEHA
jgi:uncharacterized membrane protein HdeD (DUF308 family)